MNGLFDDQVLDRKRAEIMEAAEGEGCECPVCDQFVKVYRRKITSTMARQLLELHKRTIAGQEWVHGRDVVFGGTGTGDFAKLQFWGLIEPKPHRVGDDGKKTSGYWQLTNLGFAFCEKQTAVPLYLFIYNNQVLRESDECTSIEGALTDKFDYRELMD